MAEPQIASAANPGAGSATPARDDLLRFMGELRAEGFSIGVTECMRAFEAAQYAEQVAPGSTDTLRNYLAPILSVNPDQQAEFYARFADWQLKPTEKKRLPPPPLDKRPALVALARAKKRDRRWAWVVAVLGMVLLGLVIYYFQPPRGFGRETKTAVVKIKTTGGETGKSGVGKDATGDDPVSPEGQKQPIVVISQVIARVVDANGNAVSGIEMELQPFGRLTGHTDIVWSVAFSPDGKTLASGSEDKTVRLWDADTGETRATLAGHTETVTSVAYSPDGKTLASGSDDNTIRLWDVDTGETRATLTGHTDWVISVAFSPDGKTLASGSDDGTIRLWDANTGGTLATLTGHTESVSSVAFSPNGKTLASGSDDNTIRLWEADTGKTRATLTGHASTVFCVAFSPDGKTLASGSFDSTIRLWDADAGETRATLTGHTEAVVSVAFSPDGKTLASGSVDNTIRIWDTDTGEIRATLTGHTGIVVSVAFSPDGKTLASGSGDNTIRLLDADIGETRATLTGHTDSVRSVAFSQDGKTLASGSFDKTIRLWDADTGKSRDTLTGHSEKVYSLAFSPDGKTLASGSGDETIRLWDVDTGESRATFTGHTNLVTSVAFSPDGKTLASGGLDHTIRLWDADTGETRNTLTGHTGQVYSVAFSPDGKTLASGSDDNTIRLWDADTGKSRDTLTGHASTVFSVAFSLDGKTLASGSSDSTIRLWDAGTGKSRATLTGHTDWVRSVAFSPDGKTLASVNRDKTIRLWDVDTGKTRVTLTGHTSWVTSVAYSPDGKTLASGSVDDTIRLWDLGHVYYIGQTDTTGQIKVPVSKTPRTAKIASSSHTVGAKTAQQSMLLFELSESQVILSFLRKYVHIAQFLLIATVLGTIAMWYWLRWRRREVILEMRRPSGVGSSTRVRIAKPDYQLYGGTELMDVAVQARQRQNMGRGEMDVDATVKATIAQLGFPTPVYRERKEIPVYLALIDRRGPGDQAASRVDELLDRLEHGGVVIERYDFDRDPQMFRPRGGGRHRNLVELAGIFRDCRVLMFTDGSGLMHPLTGRVREFATQFHHWEHRALLTPVAVDHWGQSEIDLAAAGFMVMPGSLQGVGAFAAEANLAEGVPEIIDPWRPPYPELLHGRVERWMAHDVPAKEEINTLCAQLRNYLGGRGYRWLCALSVYPEMNWHLTLYLGIHLTQADGSAVLDETALIDLTRLPWLRNGKMPDWLRLQLMRELTEDDEIKVRDLLRNLLEQELEQGEGFALELAKTSADKSRDWRKILKGIFQTEPASSALHDQVFVSFIFGKPAHTLQLQAPEGWRQYVFDRGIKALGIRPMLVGLLGVLGVGISAAALQWVAQYEPTDSRTSQLWTVNGNHHVAKDPPSDDWTALLPTETELQKFDKLPLVSKASQKIISPDKSHLLTADGSKWARLWNADHPRLIATIEQPGDAIIESVQFHNDGKFLRTVGIDSARGNVNSDSTGPQGASAGRTDTTQIWSLAAVVEAETVVDTPQQTAEAIVPVDPVPNGAPTVRVTAKPTSINEGGSVQLMWQSTDATNCTASGDWSGQRAQSGKENVRLRADATFFLTCTGSGGDASASISVIVRPSLKRSKN